MATFLDVTLLKHFSSIFPLLLVWAIMFGVLEYLKPFGEKKEGLYGLISMVIAVMFLLSKTAMDLIKYMAPWFIILLIFLMFMLLIFRFLGVKESEIAGVFKNRKDKAPIYWVIIFSALVFVAALGKVFFSGEGPLTQIFTQGPTLPANATAGGVAVAGEAAFWATIFHPKVLGIVFVLIVAIFAIKLLAGREGV